jgi:O-Antigen ligase
MFLFPLAYLIAFLKTMKEFAIKQASAIIIFICIGLPIYINSLSITYMYGFDKAIGAIQFLKELVVLIALGLILYQIKKKPKFTSTDWMVASFLVYSFIYAVLPIGSYDFVTRLLAFKSLSFFCILYFVGRLINARQILLSKPLKMIGVMTIIAAIIVIIEYLRNEHLHVNTGFTDFLVKYFDGEQSGNYGLIWTFETETGLKRFGSIFGSPLEMGASMLLTLSFVLAFYTEGTKKLVLTKFESLMLVASFICILLALSRASFIGYLIIIGLYAIITKNKIIMKLIYIGISLALIYFIYFITQTDIYDFVVESITFSNASSLGHLLEWAEGFNAMITSPFGLGLGESGRISMGTKDNTGGENQFIITGVQVGLPMLLLYITIHIQLIRVAYKNIQNKAFKIKRIALILFLFKMGIILPMFTSNTEAFIYISYMTWFLSGLLVNLTSENQMKLVVL